MRGFSELFRTTVGKKAVMAITGVVLFGFVLGHLAGNLKLYQGTYESGPHAGRYKIDVYGEALRELGAPVLGHGQALWIARLGLLLCVGLHIWAATTLTLQSRAARPIAYQKQTNVQATYSSRTMRWGGVLILFYVFYHLADLTFGGANPDYLPGQIHANLVTSFHRPLVAGLYIVANLALGLHLFHGLWSFFQSLGWNSPRYNPWRRHFATVFAFVITLGNVSFPVAVLLGVVR
jgi:succinate dehydrogenase / fumarate reductase cytochrome b subunit